MVGVNDLSSTHPRLVKEWNDTRDVSTVTAGSHYKATWKCSRCEYPWSAVIASRSKGAGCPRCAGRVPFPGKSFGDLFPELVDEWGDNNPVSPFSVGPKSGVKAWWVCALGHRWEARVADRSSGTGCRVCAGKEVLKGFNDLASCYPLMAAEWHPSNPVSAEDVTKTSGRTARWLCRYNHTWTATVAARTSGGNKCPYCSGRRAIRGETDLMSTHPDVAAEWHPSNPVSVSKVKRGSSADEYMWVCGKGHVQRKTVRDRVEFGCTTCSRKGRTSKGERELATFLVSLSVGDVETSVRHLPSLREVDAAIHSIGVAVEFNGVYWHSTAIRSDTDFHRNKYLAAKRDGYLLIQVWEDDWRDREERTKTQIRSVVGALPAVPARSAVRIGNGEITINHRNAEIFIAKCDASKGSITVKNIYTTVNYEHAMHKVVCSLREAFPSANSVVVHDDMCMPRENHLSALGFNLIRTEKPRKTYLVNGSRVPSLKAEEGSHLVFDAGVSVYRLPL